MIRGKKNMIRDEEINSFETKEDLVNNAKFWIGVSYNEISKYSEEIRQYKQKLAEAEKNLESAKAGLDENLMYISNLLQEK